MDFFRTYRLPLAIAIIGTTFVSAGIYYTLNQSTKEDIKISQELTASSSAEIIVDLSGEVNKPGVYTLPDGSRITDLIETAGGFTAASDQDYIDRYLNLAAPLKDGMKIYIPKAGEERPESTININSAGVEQLSGLAGIGKVRAEKIIENRPYQRLEELVEKKILPQSVFEEIKEKISVY